MTGLDHFDTVETLRRAGRPFCVATVIRTADATSAKAGAKAAITDGGEILGHLGGGCVARAVREASAAALETGEPRVIRVKPAEKIVALQDPDGAQTFRSGCPSGGTVDLLIEPYRLPPRIAIFGDTPIAAALAAHAALAGFRICRQDGCLTDQTKAETFDPADLAALALGPRDFAVVASQGRGDLAALGAAIHSDAGHVSMVASRRKAEALSAKLRAEGVTDAALARLKAPAGLDIHAVDPHEIALSILAEIVLWRNADKAAATGTGAQQA